MKKDKVSLKEQIYTKILFKIVHGEYPHNQFLTESNLVEEFGVSRILLREALIELKKDNILKSIPRAGYQIVQIAGNEIRDAIRTRAILEAGAARCALPMIGPDKLKQLEQLVSEADNARNDSRPLIHEWWERNIQFHNIIANATRNALLVDMIDKTTSILWRAAVQYFVIREPDVYLGFHPGSHKHIVDAIRKKDEENLVNLIKKDVTSMSTLFRVD